MLGDGIDPLGTLYQQWPWLLVAATVAKWIASKADAALTRHVAFVDATDKREGTRVETDKQLAVALASISDELKDHGQKLSDIKARAANCPMVTTNPPRANPPSVIPIPFGA